MGFFTVISWVIVVFAAITLFFIYQEYQSYKKKGVGFVYLQLLTINPVSVWVFILAECWLCWRYFGG